MYKINLLKGQGVPIKTSLGGIAILAVAVIVPVIAGALMFSSYLSGNVVINLKKHLIKNVDAKIASYSAAIGFIESINKEKESVGKIIGETATAVSGHTQWTDVLVTLVQNMPPSFVLSRLEGKYEKSDAGKTKVLDINLRANTQEQSEEPIAEFLERLRRVFGSSLIDIKLSQGTDQSETKKGVDYLIVCSFDPNS